MWYPSNTDASVLAIGVAMAGSVAFTPSIADNLLIVVHAWLGTVTQGVIFGALCGCFGVMRLIFRARELGVQPQALYISIT
jgi:hypothetical protein